MGLHCESLDIIHSSNPLHNYAWVIDDGSSAIVIDCRLADDLLDYLARKNLTLHSILVTHHHFDHTNGINEVRHKTGATVIGTPQTQKILEDKIKLDRLVVAGEVVSLLGGHFQVVDSKGHTLDHVMFYEEQLGWLFSGDNLISLGCGKLFEGSYEQLFASIDQLGQFSDEVRVFPGHDFASGNARFINSLGFFDQVKIAKLVAKCNNLEPLTLAEEKSVNPFLNCHNLEFKRALSQTKASPVEFFRFLRLAKDSFS